VLLATVIPLGTSALWRTGKDGSNIFPRHWVQVVRQRVEAGRQYRDAVREVLAANAELLVLARKQRQKRRR
jgi:hypothetical protein